MTARLNITGIPFRIVIGLSMMMRGSAGFERYMLQGDIPAAVFDAIWHIAGLLLLWHSLDAAWHSITKEGLDDG